MATAPKTTPATLEKAVALLGQFRQEWSNEKRHLELRIKSLEHRLFGSRSEKLPIEDQQLALIDEVFAQQEPAATQDVVVDPDIEKRVAKKPVRRPLPEHLEVVEERLEPADKTCTHCGREQCLIREESSERLDLIPARLIRRRTVRPVYACTACKDQSPVQVPMPPQVIEKGICGPGSSGTRDPHQVSRSRNAVPSAARACPTRRNDHANDSGRLGGWGGHDTRTDLPISSR